MNATGPTEYLAAVESLGDPSRALGRSIRGFEAIDSTNAWILAHGEDGLVAVADRQTAGRGRQGRSWLSAPGVGLWFTACLGDAPPGLTFAAALAVRDVLPADCRATIKWPNDVLVGGRKVCGILAERRGAKTALGIGINVKHRRDDFPDELRSKAGSLESETDRVFDRVTLLGEVLTALDQSVILLRNGGYEEIRARWAEACDLTGRTIERDGLRGTVVAIDREGALILDTPDGQKRFLTGDITVSDGV